MYTKFNNLKKNIDINNKLIHDFLSERQEVIKSFYTISGIPPFDNSKSPITLTDIMDFCQVLLDYVALGHFELYENLFTSHGHDISHFHMHFSKESLLQINKTTDVFLDFNDKYSAANVDISNLKKDLEKIGVALDSRFSLEDKVLLQEISELNSTTN